jgi:hypothetical protein
MTDEVYFMGISSSPHAFTRKTVENTLFTTAFSATESVAYFLRISIDFVATVGYVL